jgi:glutaredoxin
VKPTIEVYVHSVSPYIDYEVTREMSQHGFCDPDMANKAGEMISQFNKVKGRIYPEEDWSVLQRLVEAASQTDDEIKVYDISHTADRFKALTRGITKTPVVIINGERHEGAQKSLDALDKHRSKKL